MLGQAVSHPVIESVLLIIVTMGVLEWVDARWQGHSGRRRPQEPLAIRRPVRRSYAGPVRRRSLPQGRKTA